MSDYMPLPMADTGVSMDSSSDFLRRSSIEVRAAPVANDTIDASELARVQDADEVEAEILWPSEDTQVMRPAQLSATLSDPAVKPLPRPRSLIPTDILDAIADEEAAVLSHDEQIAHAAEAVEEILMAEEVEVDILSERVDRAVAFDLLCKADVLRAIPHSALFDLATGAHRNHLSDRALAFEEGAAADSFFVVETGSLEAVRGTQNTREVDLSLLVANQPFGLFGLLCSGSRSATVRSLGDSTVIEIAGAQLETVMRRSPEARSILARFFKERLLENFLTSHPLFRDLDPLGRAALISHFQDRRCQPGELLVSPGEVQNSIVLITSGSVRASMRSAGSETELAKLGRGEFYAVVSALSGCPTRASVVAVEATTVCMLPQTAFNEFVKGYPALRNIASALEASTKPVDRDLYVGDAATLAS